MRYARETSVSSSASRSEIEKTLMRFGADGFMYGHHGPDHVIEFAAAQRRIRFVMKLPAKTEERFTFRDRYGKKVPNPPDLVEKLYEQEVRQQWRALALLVKAKLAAVEAGIVSFEEEFLSHVVIVNKAGKTITVGEYLVPQLDDIYAQKKLPPLLPGAHEGAK